MKRRSIFPTVLCTCAFVIWCGGPGRADLLSIHDIQYTTDASGASSSDGNTIDCVGGVVTFNSYSNPSTLPRILLQDPAWPDGWDASFKLHAPGRTTVEGEVRGGRVTELKVTPEARRRNVKVCR